MKPRYLFVMILVPLGLAQFLPTKTQPSQMAGIPDQIAELEGRVQILENQAPTPRTHHRRAVVDSGDSRTWTVPAHRAGSMVVYRDGLYQTPVAPGSTSGSGDYQVVDATTIRFVAEAGITAAAVVAVSYDAQ